MATVTKPIALDESFNTTESTPRNLADVLAEGLDNIAEAVSPSTTNFAPDYDDTATYNTNDKVIYQGLLYVCLEDSVTGAWDSTKWQNISVADFTADLLPIESGSATNTKDYIDSGLSGKVQVATFDFNKTVNATTQTTYGIARSDFNLPNNAVAVSVFLREYTSNSVNAGGLVYSAYVNPTANNAVVGTIYNGTNAQRTYSITATLFYTTT